MVSIDQLYEKFLVHSTVTTDSRNCIKGSIFFALKGDRFDGNLYAQIALDNGCAYAVVDDEALADTPQMLLVPNVLQALQSLAKMHRKAINIPIIGITGSNGKTTTKELIAKVLCRKFKVEFTQGNLNNHIGVPLTVLSMNRDTQIGVVEMGANHIGEIAELCEIAQPNFGLITNIGKAHIEGFGSFEGVIQAKGELYRYIKKHEGLIFRNASDDLLASISENIECLTYSIHRDIEASVYALSVHQNPFLTVSWSGLGLKDYHLQTEIVGGYNAINIMAAICLGVKFGVPNDEINEAIKSYKPENNRSQIVDTVFNKVLLDAYNANPTSMEMALTNFDQLDHPKKVVVLGGMKELGSIEMHEHQLICDGVAKLNLFDVYLVGNEFKATTPNANFKYFDNTLGLIDYLKENPITDSLILVKGSRSNALEKILPHL